MKRPYATTRALAEMARADDDRAVQYIVAVLKLHKGNVRATAAEIGCSERTLYNWRDSNTRLATAFQQHAMGREGAGPNAARTRRKAGDK